MSVADTIEEARICSAAGRKEGALRCLLIAVAASAKKRYPHPRYGDRKGFEAFLRDEMFAGNFFGPRLCVGVSIVWNGKATPLETILYELRCSLVHEASMHKFVKYDPSQDPTTFVLRIDNKGILVFQDSLLDNLEKYVHNVSGNALELNPMPFNTTIEGGSLKALDPKCRVILSTRLSLPLA